MEKQELDYKQAYNELQSIVKEIESNDINVDSLSKKIERAIYLINYCKDKLQNIEVDVNKLIEDIER
ncbi:MAG: exodeoxyribonuclease VII small subunit [Bacteroidales bacterium]|nr:exodeoxyribonuclease VII small subunit [Bacteroidales bacterium]MBQ9312048.1 exodeoxyribonuclease VII small subunit [Bacteroidales bacterium]